MSCLLKTKKINLVRFCLFSCWPKIIREVMGCIYVPFFYQTHKKTKCIHDKNKNETTNWFQSYQVTVKLGQPLRKKRRIRFCNVRKIYDRERNVKNFLSNQDPMNNPSAYRGTVYGSKYVWSLTLKGGNVSGTC